MEKSQKSNWSEKEEEILSFWNEKEIFEKTLAKNEGKEHFVFYDGPPFATGLPHYGHLLTSIIKDAVPRYQTMKGKYVRRKWGWDCHGLPIETLIEKDLGLEHKKDIEEYGIDKFNKAAKDSVFLYDKEWKKIIPRIGRWIDMEDGYKTMDSNYTESVWWAFKELYDKGLIYKGYKSMHICPRCETTLSTTEVADGYKDITDISVTAKFELVDEPGTYVLAWTTTPWTLPGNVALAVGEDIDYVKVLVGEGPTFGSNGAERSDGKRSDLLEEKALYIVAKERVEEVFTDKEYEVIKEIKGNDLVGKSYKPVFDYYSKNEQLEERVNGWKIYAGGLVTTESGTGVVHIAPAFGDDDMKLGKNYNLPFVQHVTFDGKFKEDVKDFAGLFVKPKDNHQTTDIEIIKHLAHKGLLFSKLKINHSYPHCWRCDTPLLNYATSSWFIKVTELKDKLVELNKKVNWIPESVGDGRFGNWLENARDWSISRTRFWGAPLPVWECKKCEKREVLGSVEDIKKRTKKSGNNYFIMRHGEADNNVQNIISGKVENPHHLTDKGKSQVLKQIDDLNNDKIDIIISSPFLRTKETAQIVAKGLGIDESNIIFDSRIKEIWTGEFEGKSVDEYRAYFNTYLERFTKRPKDGETYRELKQRMLDFLYGIEQKYKDKNILVVTHESPLWMILLGSVGVLEKDSIQLSEGGEEFFENGIVKKINFSPFPHNENWELDLHRPYIDEVLLTCVCGGEMKRIADVFDCWVESGSMPFAQFHYPFENKKEFENNFPADFIAEGMDQTRGWFYTLLVLGTALFDKAPYQNVVVTGLVIAEDGKKMSKRLKNYPDIWEILNKYSSDALRYYMLSSPIVHGEELRFSERGVDEVQKKVIGRTLNVLSFYKLYEDTSISTCSDSKNVLDEWIIARLHQTTEEIEESLDKYELDRAVRPIGIFVDDLSTWYLRRSRGRFKGEDTKDKELALGTLRFVLTEFSKIIAPVMPFLAENIYREVGGDKESVHLEDWTKAGKINEKILKEMEEIRRIVSLGLEARASVGIKVRQPLLKLKVKTSGLKEDLFLLVKDEVNVKDVVFSDSIKEEVELDIEITPELKKEGQFREFVRFIQDVRKKEKFTPSDLAVIQIKTSNGGKALVEEFMEDLKLATPVKSVDFIEVEDGIELKIDNMEFLVNIKK